MDEELGKPPRHHEDERFFTRREWDVWRSQVYEYRHIQLEKELAKTIAVLNRLDTIVGKMESVAETADKWGVTIWLRLGILLGFSSPIIAVVIGHFWK